MKSRLELHKLLVEILGSKNVYFQPPENIKLKYPCIIYERSDIRSSHANNKPYILNNEYKVTVVDKNPESDIPKKVALLPQCRMTSHFVSENLNHDIFTLFY